MADKTEQATQSKERFARNVRWDVIFLGAGPALGYALAFIHEIGYCDVFGIPHEFISLSLTSIFIALGAGLGLVGLLVWVAYLILFAREQQRT